MSEREKLEKLMNFVRQLANHYQLGTPVSEMQWQLTLQYADFLLKELEGEV